MIPEWNKPQWGIRPWPWPDGDPIIDIWSIIRDNPLIIELDARQKVQVYQALVEASNALQALQVDTLKRSQEIVFGVQKQIGTIMEKQAGPSRERK